MPTLEDKVYATLAATRIASAMGAVVENWSVDRIEKTKQAFPDDFQYDPSIRLDIKMMRAPTTIMERVSYSTLDKAYELLLPFVQEHGGIYSLRVTRRRRTFVNLSYFHIQDERVLLACLENAYSIGTQMKEMY